jgi:hypothetical protein
VRDELGGHKLYKNTNGKFSDVSEAAGIYGSVIGFGLGVSIGDLNHDNWPDLYISNDFMNVITYTSIITMALSWNNYRITWGILVCFPWVQT